MRKGIRFVNIKVFAFVYIFFIFACRETGRGQPQDLPRQNLQNRRRHAENAVSALPDSAWHSPEHRFARQLKGIRKFSVWKQEIQGDEERD